MQSDTIGLKLPMSRFGQPPHAFTRTANAVILALLLAGNTAPLPAQMRADPVVDHARQSEQSTTGAPFPGRFVDRTSDSGLHFEAVASHTSKKYLIETMGSGVGL